MGWKVDGEKSIFDIHRLKSDTWYHKHIDQIETSQTIINSKKACQL